MTRPVGTDNPAAFPVSDGNCTQQGMSLRDYYIGQALANQELCTGKAAEWRLKAWFGDRCGIMPEEIAAKQAATFADALLLARNGGDGNG